MPRFDGSKARNGSLTRVVEGDRIADSVSLRISESAVLAITDPSGAGKSSFLRLLNRLDEPPERTVSLEETDQCEVDPEALRHRVGPIPQKSALRSETLRENVAVSDRIRDAPVDKQRIPTLLGRMNLVGNERRDVDSLSRGERQRVAFARTLYVEPEVLLLDEPTAHLDTETEAQIEALLDELIGVDGVTAILVPHDTT